MRPFKSTSNSLTLALLLCVALAVAGCGDGSGGEGTTPDETTPSGETTAPPGDGGQAEVVMREISFGVAE